MDGLARGPGDRVDAELQRSSLECGPALSSLFFEALNPLEALYAADVFQLLHFLF